MRIGVTILFLQDPTGTADIRVTRENEWRGPRRGGLGGYVATGAQVLGSFTRWSM